MRILVLADIHANWTALSALAEAEDTFDACICAGDIVDYGTQPQECIDWVRKHCEATVRGNHDHAVAQRVAPRGGNGFRRLAAVTRPLHFDRLDQESISWLARLPVTRYIDLDGYSFFLVHATPRDPMDEYLVTRDEWAARIESIDADFVCVGHTHIPMHLHIGDKQLINPGSVGQPRDGNPSASYAVIEDGNVELRRVKYDINAELDLVRNSGVDRDALEIAEKVLTTGQLLKTPS